jgi:hypothetical protein
MVVRQRGRLDLYERCSPEQESRSIGKGVAGSSGRAGALLGVLLALGLAVSACGGASALPGIATVETSSTTTTVVSAPSNAASLYKDELRYTECMRAHGVPNFPDPSADGGFSLPVGVGPSSAAVAACQKLLPGIGALGSGPAPTSAELAKWVKLSQCMRAHGVSDFPDPTTSVPSNRTGIGEISDRDGVILIFPTGFDQQSPLFTRAAAACGFQVTNH